MDKYTPSVPIPALLFLFHLTWRQHGIIYVCLYICTHIYICIGVCVCVCIYLHTYLHTYLYMHVCIYVCLCVYTHTNDSMLSAGKICGGKIYM